MSLSQPPKPELLMVGMGAKTYRIGNTVRKECHRILDDPGITAQNLDACKTETEVYLIIGSHPLIAKCLFTSPLKDHIELEYYPNGNLGDYIDRNRASTTAADLKRCADQMIKSIAYIHHKGVRHSDLRLDQWLVDPHLGLKGRPVQGLENSSHYLPRDPEADNTVESDLFALGSALYELVAHQKPYQELSDQEIESLFGERKFPDTEGLFLGDVIMGCWEGRLLSVGDILGYCKSTKQDENWSGDV